MGHYELSVIVPVYNGERFLEDTLDSILRQTYNDFELILVNDGSTDNTARICEKYAQKDNRIKVLHQKNGGQSDARYNGCKMALDNTAILFLDADDIISPDMFEAMMNYKDAEIVCVCYKDINSDKISEYQFVTSKAIAESMSGEELLFRSFYPKENKGNIGSIWGMLLNRDFYNRIESIIREGKQFMRFSYLRDVYCVPRFLMNASNIILLNEVYMLHRIHRFAASRLVKPSENQYELALVTKMNLDYYENLNCDFAYNKQLIGFYLTILKIWYQTVTKETDNTKKKKYITLTQSYYKEYYNKLKNIKCSSISERMAKWSIMLWGINKTLWRYTVGNIRYGIMYHLQI